MMCIKGAQLRKMHGISKQSATEVERSNEMSNILETYQQRRLTGGSKKKDVKNEHIFDESELDSIVYDNNCVVGGTVHALITLLTHHEYLGRACPSRFSYLSFCLS